METLLTWGLPRRQAGQDTMVPTERPQPNPKPQRSTAPPHLGNHQGVRQALGRQDSRQVFICQPAADRVDADSCLRGAKVKVCASIGVGCGSITGGTRSEQGALLYYFLYSVFKREETAKGGVRDRARISLSRLARQAPAGTKLRGTHIWAATADQSQGQARVGAALKSEDARLQKGGITQG